jgi:drug/metabolite transporter (DMT)-like permease
MLKSGMSVRPVAPPLASPSARIAGSGGLAVLALIAANAIWGGSAAASKEAMGGFGPFTVGAGRAGIALAILSILLALRRERPATGRQPALLGLCGIALFCAFQNLGLLFADATTTTIISGARPAVIAVLAVPLLGERLTGWRLAGLSLSVSGIGVIALVGTDHAPAATLGALLPLASAVAIAVYAVLCRRASGAGSLATVAGATLYGYLFLLPGALLEVTLAGAPAFSGGNVAAMLYLGVGCSAASFLLLGYAVSHLDVGRFAACFNIQVLAGVALSVVMLGEALTPARIGGGLMVISGVAIAARQRAVPRLA